MPSAASRAKKTTKSRAKTNKKASSKPLKAETGENEVSKVDAWDVIRLKSSGRWSLYFLTAMATVASLYFARAILFPMALAFVLYFLLTPAVRFLSRFRLLPESVSAAIVVLGVSLVIGVTSYFLAGPVAAWFSNAPETFKIAEQKLRFLLEPVDKIDRATEQVSSIANGEKKDGVVKVAIEQPQVTTFLLNTTMNFLAGLTITTALLYLLLAMGHRTLNSIVELMPTARDKRGIVALIRNVEQGISGYLISVTTINAILGLVIGTVLGLLGFPDPILLGIMAGTLNFIPFLGCLIGSAVTFLIGIVYLDMPSQALLGASAYLVINVLEGNVITPMILGRSMRLNPPIVFISIVFWGWVWGIGGILIAVPLLGIVKIACEHFDRLKPVAGILSG